jgi:calcineurin-like phosphoesterase family protein
VGADLTAFVDALWVTSDHHFAHNNIIRYQHRPFTPGDQDRELLDLWRLTVPLNEPLLHLGDLVFASEDPHLWEQIASLPGHPRWLVRGNHDRGRFVPLIEAAGFQIIPPPTFEYRGWQVICTHKPLPGAELTPRSLNVHGHIHANSHQAPDPRQINVSVEVARYKPARLAGLLNQAIAAHGTDLA